MTNFNRQMFASAAKVFAMIGAALVIVLAFATVYDLFVTYIHTDWVKAALSAFASVGLFVGYVATAATHENNAVRGVAALYALLFGGVTLCLVGLGGALQSSIFTVPEQLMQMGQVAGALLPAAGIISMISTWATYRTNPEKFTTMGASVGHYLMNTAKLTGILASMAFGFYFGVQHGVPPLVALLACGLLELLFVSSMNNVGHAHDRRDAFDMAMWGVCTVVIGGFIGLVSIESVSSIANINVMPDALRNAGATIFVSSIGISILLFIVTTVLTKLIDIPMVARAYGVRTSDVIMRRPAAEGWQVSAPKSAGALPQPAAMAMAKDEPISYAKVSESGKPYDITAQFAMPAADTGADTSPDKEITKPLGRVAEQARAEVNDPKA